MTDRRFHWANAHVAHQSLEDRVEAPVFTTGTTTTCTRPVVDLRASPDGARDKQLLFGQAFCALDSRDGWTFGYDPVDGYCGYVRDAVLGLHVEPTHRVTARSTHLYQAADIKSREIAALSFGARLTVVDTQGRFAALADGSFVPAMHISPVATQSTDIALTAEAFLGTPYLWGGNSGFGIDCSGLVQLALHAAGRTCPRDSDLQAREWQDVGNRPLARGDLVFWDGHVGLLLDANTLIHANAHHMAVAIEPLATARERIAQMEFGDVTTIRRP